MAPSWDDKNHWSIQSGHKLEITAILVGYQQNDSKRSLDLKISSRSLLNLWDVYFEKSKDALNKTGGENG